MGRTQEDPTPVYYNDQTQPDQEYPQPPPPYEPETPPPPPPQPYEPYYSQEKQDNSSNPSENEPQKQFQPPPQPQPNPTYVPAQAVPFPPQGPPPNATQSPPVWTPPRTYPPQANPQAYPPQPQLQPVAFPPPQSSAGYQQSQPPPQMCGHPGFPTMQPSPIKQTLQMNGTSMGTPVQYQQPTVGQSPIPYATPAPGDMGWSTGLFDCMDDPNNAIATAFFPCVTFGQIAEIVDNGHTSCGTSGLLYGLIAAFIGLPCIMSCTYRTKLRSRYGLVESPGPDWVTHFFCEWCALCQEYRELQRRGLNPSIGWQGNLAGHQKQEVGMVPPTNQTMMMG
ncbi:protein PLANT CADMIUM RESISTANCE 4-like [Cornus florida]|uniref:protein PLANT CADMIUM RESISTANCE 4-like n=1 Tax=Cornus florida TaxID=4283 RepID=UPI00289AD6C8|nr:protein PLANT CADMIUM RESISTANCE 4-like [Cornus florida]